jgi:16S rRNA (guanine527-N7)-methyltransferase
MVRMIPDIKKFIILRPETWDLESEIIYKYFPSLSQVQQDQFEQLGQLYPEWNARVNVISRKDIDNLYERHVLHSLGIIKVINFQPGTRILDAGTGGGFPGIPLAIFFPEAHFHLVDSTAKKLAVVQNITESLGLKNITTEHCRLEDHRGIHDFVVSRALSSLEQMVRWVWKNINGDGFNELENGILYFKGGDVTEELAGIKAWRRGGLEAGKRGSGEAGNYTIYNLSDFFTEEFFQTKKLIHLF